jgi:hypothetical protein
MRRYEATGVPALRGAAEAFWRELSDGHMFATGGSTVSETWRGAATLGDAVSQHGHSAFGGHDTHETCVSHNSMRVSRRLLSWGADGDGGEDGGGGGGGGGSSGSSSGGSSSGGSSGGGSSGGGSSSGGSSSGGSSSRGSSSRGSSSRGSSSGGGASGTAHTLSHADYYERTMLNAVLGTQRGREPGVMSYMYPSACAARHPTRTATAL